MPPKPLACYHHQMSHLHAVDDPHTRLQSEPTSTSVKAAAKAIGASGTWRERIFRKIAFAPEGLSVIELEISFAADYPCFCGCTHRSPKTQNEINTRLGELRDWGWTQWYRYTDGSLVERTTHDRTAHVNILTQKGYQEAVDRYS